MKRKVRLKDKPEVEELLKALGWECSRTKPKESDRSVKTWKKPGGQTPLKVSIETGGAGSFIMLEGSINDVELMSVALDLYSD